MVRTRIYFSAWGRQTHRWEAPVYAYLTDEDLSASDAVARAIARKSGLQVATLRPDGTALDRHGDPESHHYQMTLATPCPGGGWTPQAEVWFAIPVEATE